MAGFAGRSGEEREGPEGVVRVCVCGGVVG